MDVPVFPAKNLRTDSERQAVADEITNDPTGIGYAEKSTLEKCQALVHRERIANPEPQGTVPKPMDLMTFLGLIPQAELETVIGTGLLPDFRESVRGGDREATGNWIDLAYRQRWVAESTYTNLQAELAETIPDPDWPETVLDASRLTKVVGREVGGLSVRELDSILGG